ncbi:WD40 repeat domain-containing protein [Candidatus Chloroploca asiatica]|uniref:WD40 repeat domain-containing protein n=1 Tax=Candidatus Chloroploca asiatica TaxID=1506545 RepID=UPI001559F7C8|nr:WD40 repeat domain-containing protein [Candidatus Chloroploca asiatica]
MPQLTSPRLAAEPPGVVAPSPTAETMAPFDAVVPLATVAPISPDPDVPLSLSAPMLQRLHQWGSGVPLDLALGSDGTTLFVATALHLQQHDAGLLGRIGWQHALAVPPSGLAVAPSGALLALALGSDVELRRLHDGTVLATLAHRARVTDLVFAPGGDRLAVALATGSLVIWQVEQRVPLSELRPSEGNDISGLTANFTSVAFNHDGTYVAAGDANGTVTVWQLPVSTPVRQFSLGLREVTDLAFTPDGTTLAVASAGSRSEPGSVQIWDVVSGYARAYLTIMSETAQLAPVTRIAFASDGRSVLAGTTSGEVVRWAWPSGQRERVIQAHRGALSALVTVPGGGFFTAGRDGALKRWNADGLPLDTLEGVPAVTAVAMTTSNRQVITGGEDGSLMLWTQEGQLRETTWEHRGKIHALAVSPDERMLASAGADGSILLWSLPEGTLLTRLAGHKGRVLGLAFAQDGTLLASAGLDGTIRLWRIPEGEAVRRLTVIEDGGLNATAVLGVAFAHQGEVVIGTAYDGSVRLFQTSAGGAPTVLRTAHGGWLIALANGAHDELAALDDTGRLWVWDKAGTLLGRGALADATALAATATGHLLTVGPTGGLSLWQVEANGLTELASSPCNGDNLAVTADDTLAVVGSRRGFVEIWALP